MNSAKVQVSMDFFECVGILLDEVKDCSLPSHTHILRCALEKEWLEKQAAINRRMSFTEYKTAMAGTAERERARQRYLDSVGIHQDWRSKEELK